MLSLSELAKLSEETTRHENYYQMDVPTLKKLIATALGNYAITMESLTVICELAEEKDRRKAIERLEDMGIAVARALDLALESTRSETTLDRIVDIRKRLIQRLGG